MDKADKFGIKDHKLSLDEFMVFMERDDTSHFFLFNIIIALKAAANSLCLVLGDGNDIIW